MFFSKFVITHPLSPLFPFGKTRGDKNICFLSPRFFVRQREGAEGESLQFTPYPPIFPFGKTRGGKNIYFLSPRFFVRKREGAGG